MRGACSYNLSKTCIIKKFCCLFLSIIRFIWVFGKGFVSLLFNDICSKNDYLQVKIFLSTNISDVVDEFFFFFLIISNIHVIRSFVSRSGNE